MLLRVAVESCEGLGQSLEDSLGGGVRRGLLRSLLDRDSHQQTLQNIEQIVEARQVPQVSEDGHKHGGQDGARASEEDTGEAGPPQPQEALRARSKHPDAAVGPWWSQTPLPPPPPNLSILEMGAALTLVGERMSRGWGDSPHWVPIMERLWGFWLSSRPSATQKGPAPSLRWPGGPQCPPPSRTALHRCQS